MSIRFACECGQQLAVRDEYVGRKVRCTACSEILTVPGGPAAAPARSATTAAPPRKAAPRQEDEDEADNDSNDEMEERPRRRKKKKKAGIPKVFLAVGAVVLLLGAAFLVWKLAFSSKGGAALPDFDLVPRDAEGFISLRVADIVKTDAGKKVLDAFRLNDKSGALKDLETKAGLTPSDIERLIVVAMNAEKEVVWVIARTSKAINRKGMLSTMNFPKDRSHQGKTYHYSEVDRAGVYFLSDQQIVFGGDEALKKVLELPASPGKGPLEDLILTASKDEHQVFGAGQVPPDKRQMARQQAGPMAQQVNALLDMKSAYITADVKSKIDLQIGMEMPDKAKAEAAAKELTALLDMAKTFLAFAQLPADAKAQVDGIMKDLKPKADGNKVSIGLSVESGPLVTMLIQQIQSGGAGRQPPRRPPIRPMPG